MAITGEYNLYQQNPYNFGSLTTQAGVKAQRSEGYHQANANLNQGVPNTTPQVFGLPSVEDMELASKIASGEYGNFENSNIFMPRTSGVNTPQNIKGAAWDGYNTPANNGNGELSPVLEGREDEIEGCRWDEYYA